MGLANVCKAAALLTILLAFQHSRATELSTSLNTTEIKTAVELLANGTAHRPWTVHGLPGGSLGLDAGFESTFVLREEIGPMGDGNAVVPRVVPVPRFWFSWELPADFMLSASMAPGMLFDGITSYGAGLQWIFDRKTDWAMTSSTLFSYTIASAFGDLNAQTFTLAGQVSRDLLLWQPYASAGFQVVRASVESRVVEPGVSTSPYWSLAPHITLGARIDFLAKLSVQLNLTYLRPSFAVLLSTSF